MIGQLAFALMLSVTLESDGEVERLGRYWLDELPRDLAPDYWARLNEELPLDPDVGDLPSRKPPQDRSGRPYIDIMTRRLRAGPWIQAAVYSPQRMSYWLRKLPDRLSYFGLALGELDVEGYPLADGDLKFAVKVPEEAAQVVTLLLDRETSSWGGEVFPDELFLPCVDVLRKLCRELDVDFAGAGDPEHGLGNTSLDNALARAYRSEREARQWLRGYSWVTVVPRELTERLGGADALRATGAFFEVEELPYGGVWLQATERPEDYGPEAVRRVFQAVAPVLPPGIPRHYGSQPKRPLVYEDAANYR